MRKDPKKFTAKVPPIFRKNYTEKQYAKKILKKLYVPADKKLIESLITTAKDPKKGHKVYTIKSESITSSDTSKRLAIIAKQLKAQKGRFNLTAIFAAFICILGIGLCLTVFRKPIARAAVTGLMENSFGARCDIKDIDLNLLTTRFTIEGLAVANKKAPMKNLFEIGTFDLHFDLLELTRGKIIADNVEVSGITWDTDRSTNGSLPPAKQKKFDKRAKNAKPNPVMKAFLAETDKLKSGISLDSGLDAVKDQLDPVQLLEKEKASLKTPALVDEISKTVPELSTKWETKNTEVRSEIDTTIKNGKKASELKIASIKTVQEAQVALETIQSALKDSQKTIKIAQDTANEAIIDSKKVSALTKEADAAYKADSLRLKTMIDSIKSLNFTSGKKMISGIFNTFVINTLGTYYPYFDRGLTAVKSMQRTDKKPKAMSLKKKSGALSRAPGTTFTFGDNSKPNLLLRKINLSARDAASGISGQAVVQNVTNDANRVNQPLLIDLKLKHGQMSETVNGTIDARTGAKELVNSRFTAMGYPLNLDAGGQTGIPSLKGTLAATGNVIVASDSTVTISSLMTVHKADLKVEAFEPAILYSAYRNSLADIHTIALEVQTVISPAGELEVSVNTNLDQVVNQAIQTQLSKQVEQLKASIRQEGEAYLMEQKKRYAADIEKYTAIAGKTQTALQDIKNHDKTLQAKKAEVEKKIKSLAAEKAAPVTDAAKSLKKLGNF